MSNNDDDFNDGMIQPSLIDGLKNILDQYPDDNQILKELIQNAEDARATEVKFLYDRTQYEKSNLHHDGLANYQGPALYAYNDAEFTPEDWKGIRMIQNSVKKKDPMRVGRFGLGFKSVFHMTDLVGILSGDQLGFLDPHQAFFRNTIPGTIRDQPTSSFSLKLNSGDLQEKPNQFQPFRQSLFGKPKDYDSHFPGTLFRFPLRQLEKSSLISDTIYTDDKIRNLFDMFKNEAHSFLLFLSSIEKIEIYVKDNQNETPKMIHSIKIAGDLKHIREQRGLFRKTISSGKWLAKPCYVTFPMKTVQEDHNGTSTKSSQSWLVTHYFEGGRNSKLKGIMENGNNKMLPWAGICLPLGAESTDIPQGQIFCFLPLPAEQRSATGFHFHVHGYFAVDQNRRHLKWPSADQDLVNLNDESLAWNKGMLEEALPHALKVTVMHCIKHSAALEISCSIIYSLFPDINNLVSYWQYLAQPFYRDIKTECIYFTEDSKGEWINYETARILTPAEQQNDVITKILRSSSERSNLSIPPRHILKAVDSGIPTQVSPEYLSKFAATLNLAEELTTEERRKLVDYLSRNEHDIHHLRHLSLAERQDGQLGGFDDQLFLDSGDSGMDLIRLVPGLRHRFVTSISSKDPYYDVLSRIANSGLTGLKIVGVKQVPEILKKMCEHITQPITLDDTVTVDDASFTFTAAWHKEVWKFIEKNRDQVSLQEYHDLPLLKSGNVLHLFNKREPYLSRKSLYTTLPNDVISTLKKIGCTIVDNAPSIVHEYVANADSNGVLEALGNIQNIRQRIADLPLTKKRRLRTFLANADAAKYRHILEKLPLFEIISTVSNKSGNMIEASRSKFCSTFAQTIPVPLPDNVIVIDVRDERMAQFLVTLGLDCLTDTKIYQQYILPAFEIYDVTQKVTLVHQIMKEFERHKGTSGNFMDGIRRLRCIPTIDDSLHCPKDLFDPMDEKLQALFGNTNIVPFPKDPFRTDMMLSRLRDLDMRGSGMVTANQIVALATNIHKHVHSAPATKRHLQQAKALASFLNDHEEILLQAKRRLQNLKFIPVKRQRPYSYPAKVPWKGENDKLASPNMLSTSTMLVGSQLVIPDSSHPTLQRVFNMDGDPDLEMVIQHFKSVITSHRSGQHAPPMLFDIYGYLNKKIKGETIGSLNEIGEWVWCNNTFVRPENATFDRNLRIAAEPYMYICQDDLERFANLFTLAGVQASASYTSILHKISDEHNEKQLSKKEKSRDHEIVMAIVQHISNTIQTKAIETIPDDMLLPIKTNTGELTLKPIEHCTFCDSESFFHSQQSEVEEELFIVHPDISEQTAKLFHVPSFMSRYLDADEMDMSYGQTEPLTRRLNKILGDYKDGSAVLKELIQNADDAGASEVAFIYDKRDFTSQANPSLLDEKMREMNGPAIWSYNNSVFSDSDYENIVKLSGATKEEDDTKIGQFGLGFNAIYNLTDVPSFISRRTIVFFDPHVKFLRNCIKDKSKPGLKIDLNKSYHRMKTFKDQFKPYCDLFGWRMEEEFSGTLFRFPLRTRDQANESEISSNAYTEEDVTRLFELFKENAESIMLFTQNVKKVTISVIDNSNSKPVPKKWFTIERKKKKVPTATLR